MKIQIIENDAGQKAIFINDAMLAGDRSLGFVDVAEYELTTEDIEKLKLMMGV